MAAERLNVDDSANADVPWRTSTMRSSEDGTYRGRFEKLSRSTISGFSNASYGLRQATSTYRQLSLLQRILLACAGIFAVLVLILFLKFGESVFAWIVPLAESWKAYEYGWMILWVATVVVSFPPLIGYSSCIMVAGFVYGMTGWLIIATATIAGSTISFLVSRHVLPGFVHRLTANDRRFNALALTLKHDGLKLLGMVRLCPLPYSLSNGAISTFPTVSVLNFVIATACATPKLLIHVFIGSRLGKIAEGVDTMDFGSKALNWISIFIAIVLGIATGWFVYRQTRRRAQELEANEGLQEVERYDVDDFDVGDDEDDEDDNAGAANGHALPNGASYKDKPEEDSKE